MIKYYLVLILLFKFRNILREYSQGIFFLAYSQKIFYVQDAKKDFKSFDISMLYRFVWFEYKYEKRASILWKQVKPFCHLWLGG